MPNVSQIIKFRQQQRARDQRSPWGKLGLVSGILVSLLLVGLTMAGLWYTVSLTRDLPSVDELASLVVPTDGILFQPTRLYDRSHEHIILTLENPAAAGRQYLPIGKDGQETADQISVYLVDATIAELDPTFWKHPGYTLSGVSVGMHSTLAQKLISSLVLIDEAPSLRRNIRERLLAAQVTAKYGRERVMEWYLNSAQYGDLIYGADAAARVYFGKSATELSLAEAAMLTALIENPEMNSTTSVQAFKQQQELIIQRMLVDGYVSADETRLAMTENVQFQGPSEPKSMAPGYTKLVLMQLSSIIPLERLNRGGFDVITTLDYGLQLQADCASQVQLARISGSEEPAVTLDGTPCVADHLLPTIEASAGKSLEDLKAEVVILDPQSGQIMAMIGGGGKAALPAYPAPHPAGSIVSPFLALTAFTQGMSPASLLWDIPATNASAEPNPVQADLHQGLTASYHGPASLREVIVNDYSVAASQVLQQVGIVNVSLTEKQFGISTSIITQSLEGNLDELYSQPITLFENVEAYSVLANQGVMAGQPGIGNNPYRHQNGLSSTGILRVLGVDGQVWLDWTEPASLPVVTPQIAYLTSNVLSDERARWPSLGHPNALEIGRSAAAKVSLTVDANDAWTIGYIPQLAIGVWMGNQQAEVGGITVDMAAGLWHALMKYAASEMPVQDFIAPAGISRVQVCEPSGMLVSPLCPNIIQEVFLEGNEPTQIDDLYQKIYIDRETGLLATIFTPPELVDEAVFLVVPEEASSWARASGLPIPPTAYDSISTATPTSGEVQITKPEIGSKMRGQIRFTGSAGGDDFSYYRLQVGQGLNPQEWLQVGEDVDKPVRDGLLGTWDTKGLDGVYVVELLVVRQDMRIERAIIQITVDNTAPEVIILAPKEGEQFAYQQSEIILMNVSVSDNQGVQRVDYYLDNKAVSTLYEPPFIIPWGAQVGEHTLLIKAYDQAGNQNTTSVSFSVIR